MIKSVWCPVMQAHVTCMMDLEGAVVRVVCNEYEDKTRTCRMRRRALAGGPLAQLLARVSENVLADRNVSCPIA